MQTLDSKTLKTQWLQMQEKRKTHPELFALRSTGIAGLDKILGGGVQFGDFVIIGGAQKSGKSIFLQHWAQKCIDPFIFFSGEMTNMAIATRIFSNVSGMSKNKLRSGTIDKEEWNLLNEAGAKMEEYPGWWNYGFTTIDQIEKTIKQIKDRHDITIKTIFVDYLQLMEFKGPRQRLEQLSALSRGFKRLSTQMEQPMLVIVASQLNRQSIRSHIVDANAFLGTGDIERDMDVGLILSQEKDKIDKRPIKNARKITVVGSRETDIGECEIWFNGSLARIGDKDGYSIREVDLDTWI